MFLSFLYIKIYTESYQVDGDNIITVYNVQHYGYHKI